MKNNKGYTLVELIITLAVVSIMIVPIFNTFFESYKINLISKREISGAYVAQNVMEELKVSTKAELEALALADISDASRTFTSNSARTDFNVTVTVTDVTASLGVSLESPVISQENIPDADITMNIPFQNGTGLIVFKDFSTTDISVASTDTDLLIRLDDAVNRTFELSNITTTRNFSPTDNASVYLNIIGPDSTTLNQTRLTWNVEVVNNSSVSDLRIKRIDDPLNLINVIVSGSELSDSDVYISNSMPPVIGEVPAAKSWFNVVVEVEYDGITYEVLESTIGK